MHIQIEGANVNRIWKAKPKDFCNLTAIIPGHVRVHQGQHDFYIH